MIRCIVNPTAGHGRAGKLFEEYKEQLHSMCPDWEFVKTEYAGHGTVLASEAAEAGATLVVAMGGDGTLLEVVRGIYGKQVPLALIPSGTGNDFLKALLDKDVVKGLQKDPLEAVRHIQSSPQKQVDVGLCNGKPFLNLGGCGFDVETILCTEKVKKANITGFAAYLIALLMTIFTHKNIHAKVTVDNEVQDADFMMLTVSNGKYMGGGFLVAPDSQLDDAIFDCSLVNPVPKVRIPFLLPGFIKGKGKTIKEIRTFQCRSITIECPELFFDIDGDVEHGNSVTYEIAPEKLTVQM